MRDRNEEDHVAIHIYFIENLGPDSHSVLFRDSQGAEQTAHVQGSEIAVRVGATGPFYSAMPDTAFRGKNTAAHVARRTLGTRAPVRPVFSMTFDFLTATVRQQT
jgi:hypothetical protein